MMCLLHFCDLKQLSGEFSSDIRYANAGLRVWYHAESTNGDWRFLALNQNEDTYCENKPASREKEQALLFTEDLVLR